MRLFADVREVDRRKQPSYGYRAVHLIPKVEGCPVEIQIRTAFQHLWAEIQEKLGDLLGRGIRYGMPGVSEMGGPPASRIVNMMLGLSDAIDKMEILDSDLAVDRDLTLGDAEKTEDEERGYSRQLRKDLQKARNELRLVMENVLQELSG